jgi:hypothetical protein
LLNSTTGSSTPIYYLNRCGVLGSTVVWGTTLRAAADMGIHSFGLHHNYCCRRAAYVSEQPMTELDHKGLSAQIRAKHGRTQQALAVSRNARADQQLTERRTSSISSKETRVQCRTASTTIMSLEGQTPVEPYFETSRMADNQAVRRAQMLLLEGR